MVKGEQVYLKRKKTKTKYMILGSKNKLKLVPDVPMKLAIDNEEIGKVATIKYLGIMIDEHLEFT